MRLPRLAKGSGASSTASRGLRGPSSGTRGGPFPAGCRAPFRWGWGGGRSRGRRRPKAHLLLQKPRWEARGLLPNSEGMHGPALMLGVGSRGSPSHNDPCPQRGGVGGPGRGKAWLTLPVVAVCAGAAGAGPGAGRRRVHVGAGPGPGLLLRPALGLAVSGRRLAQRHSDRFTREIQTLLGFPFRVCCSPRAVAEGSWEPLHRRCGQGPSWQCCPEDAGPSRAALTAAGPALSAVDPRAVLRGLGLSLPPRPGELGKDVGPLDKAQRRAAVPVPQKDPSVPLGASGPGGCRVLPAGVAPGMKQRERLQDCL